MKDFCFVLSIFFMVQATAGRLNLETRDYVYTATSKNVFAVYDKKTLELVFSFDGGVAPILAITAWKRPNGARVWYDTHKVHVLNPKMKIVKRYQLETPLCAVYVTDKTFIALNTYDYTIDTELRQWTPYPAGVFYAVAESPDGWICIQLINPSSVFLYNVHSGQSKGFTFNDGPYLTPVLFENKMVCFYPQGKVITYPLKDVLDPNSVGEDPTPPERCPLTTLSFCEILACTSQGPIITALCSQCGHKLLIFGTNILKLELPRISDLQVVDARDAVYILSHSNTLHREELRVIRVDLKSSSIINVFERNYPKLAVFPREFAYMKPRLILLYDVVLIDTGVIQGDGIYGGETWPEPPILYHLWPEKKELGRFQSSPRFKQALVDLPQARAIFLSRKIKDAQEIVFNREEDIEREGFGGEEEGIISDIISFMDAESRLRLSSTSRQFLRISRVCDPSEVLFLQFYSCLQANKLQQARLFACELLRRNDPFMVDLVKEIQDSSSFWERMWSNEVKSVLKRITY